jgi:hypothetical protein
MTNLPPHLQERVETEAGKFAEMKELSLAPDTKPDYRKGYEQGLEDGFNTGASFLHALLKEEKGEVAGVWRKGLKTPQDSEWKIIVVENVARTAKYNKDSGYFIDTRGNLFEPKTLKWLDTETPVVAGCGELVDDWVSVDKGLPEFNQEVLVFGKRRLTQPTMDGNPAKVMLGWRQDLTGSSIPQRDWQRYMDKNNFRMMEEVTHWRPLPSTPAPPKTINP